MGQANILSFTDDWEPATADEISVDGMYVTPIHDQTASNFIREHHYTGTIGFPLNAYGLFYKPTEELLGVCAFHNPISERVRRAVFGKAECPCGMDLDANCNVDECDGSCNHHYSDHVTELHRLATLEKCPHNTESWFISRALSNLKEDRPKYRAAVSFADSTEGHLGTIYQASNATYYGKSKPVTFYRDEGGTLRPPRSAGENISDEEASRRGWEPEERKSKYRYLFLLPDDEYSKEDLRDMLTVESQEYPKSIED